MLHSLKIVAMPTWKVPCVKNLQITYCVNYRNIPGALLPTKRIFAIVAVILRIFVMVEREKRFVNVHLQCIASNLKIISKMSTLTPLGKFLRTPMRLGSLIWNLLARNADSSTAKEIYMTKTVIYKNTCFFRLN